MSSAEKDRLAAEAMQCWPDSATALQFVCRPTDARFVLVLDRHSLSISVNGLWGRAMASRWRMSVSSALRQLASDSISGYIPHFVR